MMNFRDEVFPAMEEVEGTADELRERVFEHLVFEDTKMMSIVLVTSGRTISGIVTGVSKHPKRGSIRVKLVNNEQNIHATLRIPINDRSQKATAEVYDLTPGLATPSTG